MQGLGTEVDQFQDANQGGPLQWKNIGTKIDNKLMSAGRDGRGSQGRQMVVTPG